MSAGYWSRQRKYASSKRPVTLHFTRHPGDSIIRVALVNRPAHDIILLPPSASTNTTYQLVRDYTKALTKLELLQLLHSTKMGVEPPTPSK